MNNSIRTQVTMIFLVWVVVLCVLFVVFTRLQRENFHDKIRTDHIRAIAWLVSLYDKSTLPENWDEYFKNFDLAYVKSENTKKQILKNAEILNSNQTPIGIVETLLYKNDLYLQIRNQDIRILLESTSINGNGRLYFIFLLSFFVMAWLFISIYLSLLPLKELRNNIKRFAQGDLDSMCHIKQKYKNDEISEVAYEFDRATCKIKDLLVSRQLFLRTIMHELKTPIGKGRIISEMLDDENKKERLIAVFERLNMLINEFAKIEQLLSKSYALKYEEYHFSLILEQARDMLMLENWDERISVQINEENNPLLKVDFGLFSLCLKNLIDNALKYANGGKIIIGCDDKKIFVKNSGEALKYPIEHYLQAFVREKNAKTSGMGLGLYIIETICKLHKFKLVYAYEDGYHVFSVFFDEA